MNHRKGYTSLNHSEICRNPYASRTGMHNLCIIGANLHIADKKTNVKYFIPKVKILLSVKMSETTYCPEGL